MSRQTKLFLGLVIVGAIVLVAYNFITREKEVPRPPLMLNEGVYQLGDVIVDTIVGEIRFDAEVRKKEGWMQHIIYLHGYKWLKEESAIISEARLADLQKAIALLDWKLWDELWYKKVNNQLTVTNSQSTVPREKELLLFVLWGEEEINAHELVLAEDKLKTGDFIFLGSPYFDHIVFEAPPGVDCRLCPMFALEEEALRKIFKRESGKSGYELNSEEMPPQGTEVTIILRLQK